MYIRKYQPDKSELIQVYLLFYVKACNNIYTQDSLQSSCY